MRFISRTLFVLLLLYGMVFVFGDILLLKHGVSMAWGIVFSVVFVGLQYLVSPYIVRWVFNITWHEEDLPESARQFVDQLCQQRGLPRPKIGLIESATPNAFAFGRVRSDARVVVTRGLIDILTPEELNAVLAHEIGHIDHYDFAVMAIASLAPLLMYQIYVWTDRNENTRVIAYGAYLAYIVSQFLVLLLNRTREYHADHFSAEVTREPNMLSSALVKIAYGMVREDGAYRESTQKGSGLDKSERKARKREYRLGGALSLMGIANLNAGSSLAVAAANPSDAAKVMRWDLVNPWARFYQLNSTHPLTALRVQALNRDAQSMHQASEYQMPDNTRVEWGRFPLELLIWGAPLVLGFLIFSRFWLGHSLGRAGIELPPHAMAWLLIATGVTWALKILYRYRGTFTLASVGTLLEDMSVSQMEPRAVVLRGEIIGNGVPGLFWSPDLMFKDETGYVFVLYRSSIPFARLLFAIGDAYRFIGEPVELQGWFRRGMRPYVELSKLTVTTTRVIGGGSGPISLFGESSKNATLEPETLVRRSYSRWIQSALAAVLTAAGIIWLLG